MTSVNSVWDEAVAKATDAQGSIAKIERHVPSDYADVDRDDLVGVPVLIESFKVREGVNGGQWASCRGLAQFDNDEDAEKVSFTLGNAAAKMLAGLWSETGRTGGVLLPEGLRRSEFTPSYSSSPIVVHHIN